MKSQERKTAFIGKFNLKIFLKNLFYMRISLSGMSFTQGVGVYLG